jgi:hypothetical protein
MKAIIITHRVKHTLTYSTDDWSRRYFSCIAFFPHLRFALPSLVRSLVLDYIFESPFYIFHDPFNTSNISARCLLVPSAWSWARSRPE